jgi:hypothetical protein
MWVSHRNCLPSELYMGCDGGGCGGGGAAYTGGCRPPCCDGGGGSAAPDAAAGSVHVVPVVDVVGSGLGLVGRQNVVEEAKGSRATGRPGNHQRGPGTTGVGFRV